MTNHDDDKLMDRFNRNLSSIEDEIPQPPPLAALTGPTVARPGQGSSPTGARTRLWALAAVVVIAAVLVGGPLALRQGRDAGATSSPAPTAPQGTGPMSTPGTTPGAGETPAPTIPPLGGIDRALENLDVPALVHGVEGGAGCTDELIPGGLSYTWDLSTATYDGFRGWVFTCPHAAGDRTVYFRIGDAIVAELARVGASGGWSHEYSGDPGGTLSNGWAFNGDVLAGTIETVTVRTGLPELTIIVTMDMKGRQDASAGQASPAPQP